MKVITQETFDAVVCENMQEFDMGAEEALSDAVKQFEAQGVNLANIVKDLSLYTNGGEDKSKHPIITALDALQSAVSSGQPDVNDCVPHLVKVQQECDIDLAHRLMASKNGAFPLLISLSKSFESYNSALGVCLDALCALCNGQPDLLHEAAAKLFCSYLNSLSSQPSLLTKVIRIIKYTCIMHEANRQLYVSLNIIPLLVELLDQHNNQAEVVKETCTLLRVLTLDDDIRVPFGKGHDHAKMIVTEEGALKKILNICEDYKEDKSVLGELFVTLSRLAVRNEFCQEIMDLGGLKLMLATLENSMDHVGVTKQVLLVLKAIAGNDEVKRAIMLHQGAAPLLVEAINKHIKHSSIAEMGCACIATVCLRQPEHCVIMVEAGAPEVVLRAMQLHPTDDKVQKQACMAVRNLVSRNMDFSQVFLDLGAEELIRSADAKHAAVSDEAKAALRDLGCSVQLTERWTGQGISLQQ